MNRLRSIGSFLIVAGLALCAGSKPDISHRSKSSGSSKIAAPMRPHRNGDGSMAHGVRHESQTENWAGYVVPSFLTGLSYTAMQASWVVPTALTSLASNARSGEFSATWIGIGGSCEDANCVNSDSTLIQLGTEQDAYSTGAAQYYAWYEILPADSVMIPYAISPGDSMTASLKCTAACSSATQTWLLSMSDSTAGWNWSTTLSYASLMSSADWIEEATSTCGRNNNCTIEALANFGQVTFTQGTANGANPNFDVANDALQLVDSDGQSGNPSNPNGGNAFTVCWGTATFSPCSYASGTTPLVAAVLPSSRSVEVGGNATAFATIINGGSTTATGCEILPASNVSASLSYQTTSATTNGATGTANAAVDIAAGAAQSFVIDLSPSATIASTNVGFEFVCTNANAAPIVTGVDTLLLSGSTTPVPDLVALSATSSGDGILHIAGRSGTAAFALATVNVGAASTITASANTGSANLPLSLTICQTNPSTGQCLQTPTTSVQATVASNATPTFAIFAAATGAVPFLPQTNRIFVQFRDPTSVRGSTSVAVETQ
jgi:hypothetical protein